MCPSTLPWASLMEDESLWGLNQVSPMEAQPQQPPLDHRCTGQPRQDELSWPRGTEPPSQKIVHGCYFKPLNSGDLLHSIILVVCNRHKVLSHFDIWDNSNFCPQVSIVITNGRCGVRGTQVCPRVITRLPWEAPDSWGCSGTEEHLRALLKASAETTCPRGGVSVR